MKQTPFFESRMAHSRRILFLITCFVVFLNSSAFAQDAVKIRPVNSKPKAVSIYELSFTTTETLNPDGQISIVFPDNIDLSKVRAAGSSTINGGFKTRVDGNKIILSRTGLGRRILPNKKVDVKFANIVNPTTGEFSVVVEFQSKVTPPIKKSPPLSVIIKNE